MEAPNIVGHFLGGMIAAEMAALRPSSVGKLVLAAPAGLWLDHDPGVDYFATPIDELRGVLFADPNSDAAKSILPEPKDDLERGTQIIERVRSLATVGKFLWPIPDKGLKKRMPRITAPTLVIVGENDKIVPASYGRRIRHPHPQRIHAHHSRRRPHDDARVPSRIRRRGERIFAGIIAI